MVPFGVILLVWDKEQELALFSIHISKKLNLQDVYCVSMGEIHLAFTLALSGHLMPTMRKSPDKISGCGNQVEKADRMLIHLLPQMLEGSGEDNARKGNGIIAHK